MVVYDYTSTLLLPKATVRYRNPRHFKGPKEGADYVYTKHPHIAKAYAEIGVPEYKENNYEEQTVTDDVQSRETDGVETIIPDDFESLNFFKQRAIAQKLTDEEVRTKEDVQRVISRSV